jgi:hypothetical protein
MQTITEQQMFDYIFCPARYHIKYIMNVGVQEPVTMQKMLSKVSKYFFMNLLNGKVCTYKELKSKWDSICTQYPNYFDPKKNITGWGHIVNFVQWAAEQKIIIGDIDQSYRLYIDGVELVGNIETILVNTKKQFELLYINFNDKDPDQIDIDQKLKYSLDAFAFKSMYKQEIDGIKIHSAKSNRDYLTYRTIPDMERLTATITNVAKGIQNNIFYPRESHLCSSCTSRELCRFWTGKI